MENSGECTLHQHGICNKGEYPDEMDYLKCVRHDPGSASPGNTARGEMWRGRASAVHAVLVPVWT